MNKGYQLHLITVSYRRLTVSREGCTNPCHVMHPIARSILVEHSPRTLALFRITMKGAVREIEIIRARVYGW
jgi:hypothetical protein